MTAPLEGLLVADFSRVLADPMSPTAPAGTPAARNAPSQ